MVVDQELGELRAEYIEECRDIFERMYAALVDIEARPIEVLAELMRGVHTIKGGASIFEMGEVSSFAHHFENELTAMRDAGKTPASPAVADIDDKLHRLESMVMGGAEASVLPTVKPSEVATAGPAPSESSSGSTPSANEASEVIRVPADRIQRAVDLVSETILLRNQFASFVDEQCEGCAESSEFVRGCEQLNDGLARALGELQSVTVSMRMTPVRALFRRMEQTVRSYLRTTGKRIEVSFEGEDTEIDKAVMDSLAEPLVHLVRNAMDHGIEESALRSEAGKPETGQILLSARLVGNEVQILVRDDGRGLDPERIIASARKKGLDVQHISSTREAQELIFMAGFSTAAALTSTSGRGVGMDAVKNYVEQLGGRVELDSEVGKGTCFSLGIPLGMSVVPALVSRIGGQSYAISADEVLYSKQVPARALRQNNGQFYYCADGHYLPCYDLEALFRGSTQVAVMRRHLSLCVARCAGESVAFAIGDFDAFVDVAVKPMPASGPDFPYVTGVCLLSTGEPALVLSLGRLLATRRDALVRAAASASPLIAGRAA